MKKCNSVNEMMRFKVSKITLTFLEDSFGDGLRGRHGKEGPKLPKVGVMSVCIEVGRGRLEI